MKKEIQSVDEYLDLFSEDTRVILEKIREIVLKNAPDSNESISYGMPAYKSNGKPLVYFAAYKKHIGFYATPSGHSEFEKELSNYKNGKGSVQFPLNQPIPYDIIQRIVIFRLNENQNSTPGS